MTSLEIHNLIIAYFAAEVSYQHTAETWHHRYMLTVTSWWTTGIASASSALMGGSFRVSK